MKSDKGKNTIIILLIIIILILVGIITLLFTGTITLNTNKETEQTTENEINNEEIDESKNIFEISYKEEEYVTKNKKGYIISKSTRNLPIITNSNNQSAADKIVNSLTSFSDESWNNNIKQTADATAEMDSENDLNLGVTYLFNTGIVTDNRLTFMLKMGGSFGGVSWNENLGYNYDAITGELLTLESISTDSTNLKDTIYNEVVSYVETNNIDIIVENWKTEVSKLINADGNWYFKDNSIEISLPKYSISTGASGIIKIEIDKTKINNYLKEEYKI